ncbi:hypothetical protein AB0C96_17110 [Streptomyces sp. NPDC048506]|uniref:hypothetical protein n=1 Tax=Streptomyces sp. NPDC048506 TaxID=3155028 RepID=UPI0034388015
MTDRQEGDLPAAAQEPEVAEVLTAFRTGYQATRVTALPDGRIRWQHTPGTHHDGLYPPVRPDVVHRLHAASDPHIRFTTPSVASPTECSWDVNGRHSLASWLVPGEDDPTERLHETIGRLGLRLRALHDQPPGTDPPTDPAPPPGPARLLAWLDSGRAPRAGAGFHHRLRAQLGPARWEKLRDFTHHLLHPRPTDRTGVVHGWFSLGRIIVADPPDATPRACVLSGFEATWGRPELDLACLIGELAEYRKAAERAGADWPVPDTLQHTFLTHYGTGWEAGTLAAGAVVRIATHAHDFAAYIGWGAQLHGYVPMLTDLLDTDGAASLAVV